MKWTYVIKQKLRVAFFLTLLALILIGNSLLDKKNFSEIQNSFISVYEDRLLVESYIYEISDYLYQKKLLARGGLLEVDTKQNIQYNDSIEELLSLYENTLLTTAESKYFSDLTNTYGELLDQENGNFTSVVEQEKGMERKEDMYNHLNFLLHKLSEIQKSETKKILDDSNQLIATSSVVSHFEIIISIVLVLSGHILIFATKSSKTKISQDPMLN